MSADQLLASVVLRASAGAAVTFLIATWGAGLDALWRTAVRLGASQGAAWCICCNARALRLVDARHTYARRYVEFDLETALASPGAFAALWGLLRADAFAPPGVPPSRGIDAGTAGPLIDRIVEASARRAVGVCAALRRGVFEALVEILQGLVAASPVFCRSPRNAPPIDEVFEQALTIVYRVLFLLYAEARGLMPVWHPVYRDSYAIETLRSLAEQPRRATGIWATLQAMSRLSHAGCRAGSLRVTGFNGRLFSPDQTPLGETCAVDDEAVRRAILALSTEPGRGGQGRARISYRDLGVEQLGSVYESILEHEPRVVVATPRRSTDAREIPLARSPVGAAGQRTRPTGRARVAVRLEPGSGRRKATGTFYTPRPITEFLVRSVLDPLVAHAAAETILQVRVLDLSMGSGAFLVAACRYLAAAYEAALVREGVRPASDIDEAERAGFRRAIAQRCLFGVDLNPMAVQLARVSLWLTTLAADRPLTFLDHHLRVGDSLTGASPDDIARQPPGLAGGRGRAARPASLPLFEASDLEDTLRAVLPVRSLIEREPGDSLDAVRSKETALAALDEPASGLSSWKAVADLWCACWFWDVGADAPDRRIFGDLVAALLHARSSLSPPVARTWHEAAHRIALRRRFFHWTLEFPEVFYDAGGRPLTNPGFDAVVGNPPWDMLRADRATGDGREPARAAARQMTTFARASGVYSSSGEGHANLYQLFVERALRLTRSGGRVGLVVPWGLASDHGCARLRRWLFERADTDTLVGFDNAAGVFPIHRSVRFLAFISTVGGRTGRIRCRFGERNPQALDAIPHSTHDATPAHYPLTLTPSFIRRLSGDDLSIPDIRTPDDLAIVERVAARFPRLASADGWGAEFSRELNATEDRRHFRSGTGRLPVVEGKHLGPFRVRLDSCAFHIREDDAATIVDPERTFRRARLAYRDVASATNRLTLIAAVVPRGCLTTHTLFCLRTPLTVPDQAFLCGLLNSYIANFLVRQRVTTHVSAGLLGRIPAPRPPADAAVLREGAELSEALAASADPEQHDAYPRLQALVASAYQLTPAEFSRVLESFPLVDPRTREAARLEFSRISRPSRPAGC
ncbi:MAG: N-6 DNA methylase [Acidobacteria bacterium]|nr:N-6 DNA methylase [Acidobacteriota bacterium]